MAADNNKEFKGPGGRRMAGRPRPKVENPGLLLKRVFSYVFRYYGIQMIVVLICIVVSVLANIQGTMFTRTLIDTYITPMIGTPDPDYGPLLGAMGRVACFYGIGIAAAFTQQVIMVHVNQGTLRRLREDLFDHMESLPIKYFDTHSHGDIMSVYTNDIDTLRHILSIPLTLLTLAMVALMLFVTMQVTKRSGKNFIAQQKNLGKLNGFIEETMTGQKVVKVFCHEEESIKTFDQLNEELYQSAYKANAFANMIGPVNAQMGNANYVIVALVGGLLALNSYAGFTVGGLASFLTFNKSFSMPINQVSMQFNSIIMALAGAERVFKLLDEEPSNFLTKNRRRTTDTSCWSTVSMMKAAISLRLRSIPATGRGSTITNSRITAQLIKNWRETSHSIMWTSATGMTKWCFTTL